MSGYAHENRGERCDRCGQLLFGRRRRRRTPAYCSRVCSNRAQAERRANTPRPVRQPAVPTVKAAARLEDLRWMLKTGESRLMICHRLGVRPHALARWLSRHGQHDLARLFYGLDKQHQAAA